MGEIMELNQQCIEEIILAAREAENGRLVITIESRPEDAKNFDLKCDYTKRFRVPRKAPTEDNARRFPKDKYS
jgi:hypothetical protein